MSEELTSERISLLLEESFSQHLSFVDGLLASPRKEVVQAALELVHCVSRDGFDSQAARLITTHEHFEEVLAILLHRPRKTYASFLMKRFKDFPVRSQEKVLESLAHLGEPFEVSEFIVHEYPQLDPSLRVAALMTLVQTGDRETLDFVLQRMAALPSADEMLAQQRIFAKDIQFDMRATRWFIEQFQTKEAMDIRAGYLQILARGEPETAVETLTENLRRQPEMIVSAAFDALIEMGLHEQIPEDLLDLYSASRFYRLSVNVARIFGIKYRKTQDRDALKKGLNIISWLLNDDTRDARLAAIEGSRWFPEELRVVDWVGSLLLSTEDEEILRATLDFLQTVPKTPELKSLLLKAFDRSLPYLELRCLKLLESFAETEMIPMLLETIEKDRSQSPLVAAQAIRTLAHCMVVARESEFFPYLKEDSPELLQAAIEGMAYWNSDNSRRALEKEYQNYVGAHKAISASVLFKKGVSYIPDDVHVMLSSDHPSEQRTGLNALRRMFEHVRHTPVERLHPDLISNLELWHSESIRRRSYESVIKNFDPRRVLPLRLLILQEKYEEALQWIEQKREDLDEACWFLDLAAQLVESRLGREAEPEPLLQLIERAPEHISGHELTLNCYRRMRRRSEFVHHQLQLLEFKHKCYGQLLQCLNEMSKEEYDSTFCLNLMKLIQNASLPSDISIHQVLSQAYLRFKRADLAYEQLVYGVFSIPGNQWYVDLTACALKTSRPAIARQMLKMAPKLGLPPAIMEKMQEFQKRMDQARKDEA